jgi:hypothetical protein
MRSFLTVAALALSLAGRLSAQNATPTDFVITKAFPTGGSVGLTMNVGDLKVLPAPAGNTVKLEIKSDRSVDKGTLATWVHQFQVEGNRATLNVQLPKNPEHCTDCHGNTSVTLYVPQRTDLKVDLDVGDVTVSGILGDKDLRDGVGDLRIAIADPAPYGHVETHTRVGNVNDFLNRGGKPSGFLGKDEDFALSGRFHVKASVGVGDLNIVPEGKS